MQDSKIFIAGHKGLVGSAILLKLKNCGYSNILTRTRSELNLTVKQEVKKFFETEKPEYVILAAAKVRGILANETYPAQFIHQNLTIQTNVIHHAYLNYVKKLVFLGSSCVYPKNPDLPIKEDTLLTGSLEKTNEAYAIAKIAGIKMCQAYNKEYGCNFISVMPTNLYGPNDNYHPQNSHVLAALIQKIILADRSNDKSIELWGSGEPMREFLHVDDLANACLFLLKNYNSSEIINVGTGKEISINDLAKKIVKIIGYTGEIMHDHSRPDGTYRKVMDISKILSLGWKPKITLTEGLKMTIEDYRKRYMN